MRSSCRRRVVIDVGAIEDRGWAVAEANPAWASGLCGCEPARVLAVLRACVVAGEASEAARWLRPRAGVTR
ncbi:ATP-grasp domain-containing protein [Nannocystis punicea]|uniref:ATP-grasp domain-containing protein n=1 Tax=Nannocystis punicea TaxID=2995304 RepID=A0ABY7GYV1_9BACT|nr:ATP-grasp domain-containing protein [Nannocystis poenicansa]WAS92153.1 ATP-grasp domain-containing protein [Nannocystis poenicansa]